MCCLPWLLLPPRPEVVGERRRTAYEVVETRTPAGDPLLVLRSKWRVSKAQKHADLHASLPWYSLHSYVARTEQSRFLAQLYSAITNSCGDLSISNDGLTIWVPGKLKARFLESCPTKLLAMLGVRL